jgi:hypothetical protein
VRERERERERDVCCLQMEVTVVFTVEESQAVGCQGGGLSRLGEQMPVISDPHFISFLLRTVRCRREGFDPSKPELKVQPSIAPYECFQARMLAGTHRLCSFQDGFKT